MALDFKRILCPVDLSRLSLDALKLGAKMAESSDATLYFLHVIDNPFDELYMTSITQADPALLEVYRQEPLRRAKVMKATVEHSEVMLKTVLPSVGRTPSQGQVCYRYWQSL